jgi:hypothetical protein
MCNLHKIIALLVLSAVCTNIFGRDYTSLTKEQFNNLSEEEKKSIPLDLFFGFIDPLKNKDTHITMTEILLEQLHYYHQLPTGKVNKSLEKAIRDFQRDINEKQTGILTAGQFEILTKRAEKIHPIDIGLPGKYVWPSSVVVSAAGTYQFQNQDMAWPLQTTQIQCIRSTMQCNEVTATVGATVDNPGHGLLSLYSSTLTITKWTDEELVAEDDTPLCVAYTLTINLIKKDVRKYKREKGAKGCEDHKLEGGAQLLELVDGFNLGMEINRRWNQDALKMYSKEYQDAINRLSF